MNKIAFLLWVSLVVYTLIYVLFIQSESNILMDILSGVADPFASSFFNLMGLVPLYFLLDYLCFQSHSKWGILPYLFGFVGGAFSILLGYKVSNVTQRSIKKWVNLLIIILMIFTGLTFLQAFLQGNPSQFFSQFFQDSLVGIMTIDFLVLYGWSIYRSKQLFPQWYVAFIPIIGFGLLMLLNHSESI
jgi:hypothetical protein